MPPRLPRLPRLPLVRDHASTPSSSSTCCPSSHVARAKRAYSTLASTPFENAASSTTASTSRTGASNATANFPRPAGPTRTLSRSHWECARGIDLKGKGVAEGERGGRRADEARQSLFEGGEGEPSALPAESATSSAASTSKLPPAPPNRRPPISSSPLPSLPRDYLFPVVDSLFEQPLPSSESELYSYLQHTKATQPSTRPHSLAWLHSQPRISPLTSTRTYRVLVQYAFEDSNLRLVRELLSDMQQRGISRDKQILRVMLRGYLRHGKEEEAKAVAAELGEQRAVLLPTKPVVLDTQARGRKLEQLDVLWKGWDARGRDRRAREEALRWQIEMSRTGGVVRTVRKGKRRRGRTPVPSSLIPASRTRPLVTIPRSPSTLPNSDITTLVDVLVQESRVPEAFALAKSWLRANQPSFAAPLSPPPSSSSPLVSSPSPSPPSHLPSHASCDDLADFGHKVAQYHSTALVLLHLVLRSLYAERTSRPLVLSFISAFLQRYTAPPPARPLTPNNVTLRTLLCGLRGVPDAWKLAKKTVDWFGYRWGLPVAGKPDSHRRYFAPPSQATRSRLWLKEDETASPRAGVRFLLETGLPLRFVSADIAILLLLHAVESRAAGALWPDKQVEEVRVWWDGLDRDPLKDEAWTGWRARAVVKRAKEEGLFVSRNEEKRRRLRKMKEAKAAGWREEQEKQQQHH